MFTKKHLFGKLFLVLLFQFVFSHNLLFAQWFVQDSLIIKFGIQDNAKPIKCAIDTVIDQRDEYPRVVGRYEKNKYLFVPVDLLICTKEALKKEIIGAIPQSSNKNDSLVFKLIIDEFRLTKKTNSLLYPRYLCNVSVQLYLRNGKSNSQYMGRLLYESSYRTPFFGDNLKKGFESATQSWQQQFSRDLTILSNSITAHQNPGMENLRSGNYRGKNINMLSGLDVALCPDAEIMDGEIFFSQREARKCFFRSGGYHLRYRNMKDFDSIEFGLSNDYLFYRFHPRIVLRGKSQILFGLNRWKNFETVAHKIYDAFIFDYSLSQSLIYNPIDKRFLTFGIGVQENLFYVYSKDIQFQLGLLIHLGVKL